MVSAESSAGTEEETSLDVPERATRLHLRWESEKNVPSETAPLQPSGPSQVEKLVSLPDEILKMKDTDVTVASPTMSEEGTIKFHDHTHEPLQTEMRNIRYLEDQRAQHGPVLSPLSNQIKDQQQKITRLTEKKSLVQENLKAFISSTMDDLQPERKIVGEALEELYIDPVIVDGVALSDPPRKVCLSWVRKSDIYVGIFWQRYGTITDQGVSATIEEYQQAKKSGKPILIYIKEPAPERETLLTKFLKGMKNWESGHVCHEFDSLEKLKGRVKPDVMRQVSNLARKTRRIPPMTKVGQAIRDKELYEALRYEVDDWDDPAGLENVLSSIKQRLAHQRNNFSYLQDDKSQYGPEVPFKLRNNIKITRKEIDKLGNQRDLLYEHLLRLRAG